MKKTHHFKTLPEPFEAMWQGQKPFEIRNNDRDYKLGDKFCSQEYDPIRMTFSGREIWGSITYFVGYEKWGLPAGLCVFGCGDLVNIDNVSAQKELKDLEHSAKGEGE